MSRRRNCSSRPARKSMPLSSTSSRWKNELRRVRSAGSSRRLNQRLHTGSPNQSALFLSQPGGGTMSEQQKKVVKIELTEEQRKLIKEASGAEISAFEITAEQLEERIAPARFN